MKIVDSLVVDWLRSGYIRWSTPRAVSAQKVAIAVTNGFEFAIFEVCPNYVVASHAKLSAFDLLIAHSLSFRSGVCFHPCNEQKQGGYDSGQEVLQDQWGWFVLLLI